MHSGSEQFLFPATLWPYSSLERWSIAGFHPGWRSGFWDILSGAPMKPSTNILDLLGSFQLAAASSAAAALPLPCRSSAQRLCWASKCCFISRCGSEIIKPLGKRFSRHHHVWCLLHHPQLFTERAFDRAQASKIHASKIGILEIIKINMIWCVV